MSEACRLPVADEFETLRRRRATVYANRPRGIYFGTVEAAELLGAGWQLLDDCPGCDELLIAPPAAADGGGP